jgi:hypothetical protein
MAIEVLQFRQYADKCRKLASSDRPQEERSLLRQMADAWEVLARQRQEALFGQDRGGKPERQYG